MASKLWWLIHKDLIVEYRSRQAIPAMLLLSVVVAVMFCLQMDMPLQQRPSIAGPTLWLAIFFGGWVAIDRTFAVEQFDGCWDNLRMYPLSASMIYIAKWAVNFFAIFILQLVLLLLFVALADVPLLKHPGAMLGVTVLGSAGLSAIGTLVSAITHGLRQRSAVLALLLLPLVLPLILAAVQATRFVAEDSIDARWLRWIQLLGAFDIAFITLGLVLFGFLMEE